MKTLTELKNVVNAFADIASIAAARSARASILRDYATALCADADYDAAVKKLVVAAADYTAACDNAQ